MTSTSNRIEHLKSRYRVLRPNDLGASNQVSNIEAVLKVKLPSDFAEISDFLSGGGLGMFFTAYVSTAKSRETIVEWTKSARSSVDLLHDAVVLGDCGNGDTLIVLFCNQNPAVVWCSPYSDFSKQTLDIDAIMSWESYTDFIEYLIEEEENEDE